MRQRVMIAMAVASEPQVLLCDEPTTALDVTVQAQVLDLLDALRIQLRLALVFVSHDLDEALRLGDRITILQNGRIIQSGTAEDIVMAPADDYVAEFVRHMNPLDVLTGAMIMQQRLDMPGDGGSVIVTDRSSVKAIAAMLVVP